ncbi:hypothetical protein QRB38_13365 [Mycobacterium avium subsp. hominissuis]|uniref:hypothetical protein n=1 Tax=Mycobacterium avium TaxID=1764 RepID=UPI00266564F1|nr:hypothetical protein [Mycobacterium avium]MDO2394800.1 hypothetical protein [Mycobacterium avium subsp. hominissuis]
MCRAVVEGGRRCPCTRGDRRRAYQRMRYAARQAAATATQDAHTDTGAETASAESSLAVEDRRAETAAAVDAALAALREHNDDPAVGEAYLAAVLDHGTVLRDTAAHKIEQAYAARGLDDAAVEAETAAVAEELKRLEDEWAETRKHSNDHLTADGASFTADGAAAIDAARNAYAARKQEIYRRAMNRSKEINEQRIEIAKQAYYDELSQERQFGGPAAAAFVPTNTNKMTRADRALFTSCVGLYPDEMVECAAGLGDMLAKRSKARAHYSAGAAQRSRRSHTEVFDLEDALQSGRFRFNHFVSSPDEAARGGGGIRDRYSTGRAFVARTPDNERKVGELVARHNEGRRQHATIEYATIEPTDGGEPYEVIYVKGPRKRVVTEVTGVSAELTFSDSSSMTHELGHRMEDRNPEISVATKAFLKRRTAGLAPERYAKGEMVVADGFADRYMGKDYPGHHTELLSCGMEAITHGRFGGLTGRPTVFLPGPGGLSLADRANRPKADPEHLALVLGLLAAANKRLD